MLAEQLKEKGDRIIGWRILTKPQGNWPGGPAEIMDLGVDDEAPEIVFNVRGDNDDEIGVFGSERVRILRKSEHRGFNREDCPHCHYLGHFQRHDLYFCTHEVTVIARFGADGNYCSGLVFGIDGHSARVTDEAIRECMKRSLGVRRFRELIHERMRRQRAEFPERYSRFETLMYVNGITESSLF